LSQAILPEAAGANPLGKRSMSGSPTKERRTRFAAMIQEMKPLRITATAPASARAVASVVVVGAAGTLGVFTLIAIVGTLVTLMSDMLP
jgi:hypothetical protein